MVSGIHCDDGMAIRAAREKCTRALGAVPAAALGAVRADIPSATSCGSHGPGRPALTTSQWPAPGRPEPVAGRACGGSGGVCLLIVFVVNGAYDLEGSLWRAANGYVRFFTLID